MLMNLIHVDMQCKAAPKQPYTTGFDSNLYIIYVVIFIDNICIVWQLFFYKSNRGLEASALSHDLFMI